MGEEFDCSGSGHCGGAGSTAGVDMKFKKKKKEFFPKTYGVGGWGGSDLFSMFCPFSLLSAANKLYFPSPQPVVISLALLCFRTVEPILVM